MNEATKKFLCAFFRDVSFTNLSPRVPEFGTYSNGEEFVRFGDKWSSECVEMFFPANWISPHAEFGERLYTLAEVAMIMKRVLTLDMICYLERELGNEPVAIADVSIKAQDNEHVTVTLTSPFSEYSASFPIELLSNEAPLASADE